MKTMLSHEEIPGTVVLKNLALWWPKDQDFREGWGQFFNYHPWGEPGTLLEEPVAITFKLAKCSPWIVYSWHIPMYIKMQALGSCSDSI